MASSLTPVSQSVSPLASAALLDKPTYDPTLVEGDAFDMDNMAEGANTKILTSTERTKVATAVQESDTSTAAMSFVIDEDNMASDSATKVPTQQSVKAYADAGDFPSGTAMVFYQDAAPTGWTKYVATDFDNAGLRLVTSTAWTSGATGSGLAFAPHTHTTGATGSHVHTTAGMNLSLAQIPAHDHDTIGYYRNGPATVPAGGGVGAPYALGEGAEIWVETGTSTSKGSGGSHSHGNTGDQGLHSHTVTTITPKWIKIILATKD